MTVDPEILKRLDALATKLGVTADHLWGVLVRQARVEFIVDAGLCLLWITVCFLTGWGLVKLYRSEDDDKDFLVAAVWLLGGFFLIGGLASLYYASELPGLIMNPEFWALKQVLEVSK